MLGFDRQVSSAVSWLKDEQRVEGATAGWGWVTDVPANPQNTAEVVCARLARSLHRRGFDVVCLDGSLRLAHAAATSHELPIDAVAADVAAVPFRDRSFDVVVAFMVLHDVGNLDRSPAEIARLLRVDGLLCASIVHRFWSATAARVDAAWQ